MSLIDVVSQREIGRKDCGPGPAWARPECDLTYILVDLHLCLLTSHLSLSVPPHYQDIHNSLNSR